MKQNIYKNAVNTPDLYSMYIYGKNLLKILGITDLQRNNMYYLTYKEIYL